MPARFSFRNALLLLALLATSIGLSACRQPQPPADGATALPGAAETEAANALAGGQGESPDSSSSESSGDGSAYWANLEDHEALMALLREPAPARDPIDLALRLGRIDAAPPPPPNEPVKTYAVGDLETFWLHDITRQKYFQVDAKLEAIRPGGYFWVQVDQTFNAS